MGERRPVRRTRRDPRSPRRAGRQVRRRLRQEALAAAKQHWKTLAPIAAGWLLVVVPILLAVMGLIGASGTQTAFVAGLAIGVLPLLWVHFLIGRGLAHRGMGAEAEEWTAIELAKLGRSWTVCHDVPLRFGNVDHVAAGPGRVYAVETKWTAGRGLYLGAAAKQAQRGAEATQESLRARGVDRDVIPLLVVWGPGVADSMGEVPKMIETTRVVAGYHSKEWVGRMTAAADQQDPDSEAVSALLDIVNEQESGRSRR